MAQSVTSEIPVWITCLLFCCDMTLNIEENISKIMIKKIFLGKKMALADLYHIGMKPKLRDLAVLCLVSLMSSGKVVLFYINVFVIKKYMYICMDCIPVIQNSGRKKLQMFPNNDS